MPIIELKGVTKEYGQGHTLVQALKPTDFRLEAGQFVAIIGPSGSGKTTFLTLLGHLQTPSKGQILLRGKDTSQLKEKERAALRFNDFGFILQASNLIPFLKIEDQFQLIDRLSKKERTDLDSLIELLDLKDTLKQYPKELSGGERQRAAIARALYNSPDIILADEPTASLDTERAKRVVHLLKEVTQKFNKSVVMITHDNRLLDEVDKVYEMQDGVLTQVR
ncbi:ABC transporter ATP-binding protein [Streptococcus cristatus]|uniref:Putative hemin import ATP-binding protein HrtA n=1 Tax=Streptococcus cristatus TaxID=45634 RepID=A0A3R9LBE9_STRCR|nr:ABC transporter ATP-binding protein [Streptococcus cristatus]RSJ94930.1 putative hemin import ATP-binding protein HrtA [Streptococcus cristatus]